jgi:molybdopterin/thiamine biosynthesis adenylyltransferase
MSTTLRITDHVYRALRRHHLDPAVSRERISYVFGRAVYGAEGPETILISDAPIIPADDCYLSQSGGYVALEPGVVTSIVAQFARTDCDVLLNCHDHWFSPAKTDFSSIDSEDDLKLSRYFRERFEPMLARRPDIGKPRQVISLSIVFDQAGLAARYVDTRGSFCPIDRVEIVGPLASRLTPNNASRIRARASVRELRQRDFITPEQQAFIAETSFAIVGCGGLGSIVAEAFLRLGGRRFLLFDPDQLEAHNLNRWQGGRVRDIGVNKAELLALRLKTLSGGRAYADAVPLSVFAPEALPHLTRADVVLGCLDTHVSRNFLNRFSVQYLTPYFDAGVNITAGEPVDFQSRYFAVIPGHTACAECTGYDLIDRQQVDHALMDDATANARAAAGYVDERPEITGAASAYPLNMRAASTLTTEFLNWVCGYRPFATTVAEYWATGRHQRSDRANHPEVPDPACANCTHLLGAGSHAELPRPQPVGRAARLLTDAREYLLSRSTLTKGINHGST